MLEKTKERGTRAQNFFFFRGKREHSARGSLESSLVFQSATLELPRALSRLFSLGRERQIKKKRSKNPKEEGLRRELGGKNKTYIYTRHIYIYHARTHRKRAKTQKTNLYCYYYFARETFLLKSRARWKSVRRPELFSLRSQVFFCSLSFKKPPFSKKRGLKFWKKVSRFTRDLRRASIRRRGKKRNQRNKRALCFRLRLFLPLKIDANVANAFETSRFLRLFFCQRGSDIFEGFFPSLFA